MIHSQPLQRLALLSDEEIDAAMETVHFHHKQFDALFSTLHMESILGYNCLTNGEYLLSLMV